MSEKKAGFFSRRRFLKWIGGLMALPAMGLSFFTTGCLKGKTLAKQKSWPAKADWDLLRS